MGIEEEIRQKQFASEVEKAIVNLTFTSGYVNSKLTTKLKPFGISIQQFNVLRILKGSYPDALTINDITSRMLDKMSNASRLVDKLQHKGLVDKKTCDYDKRQLDIVLSKEGHKVLEDLNKAANSALKAYEHMPEEDLVILNTLLNKLREKD